MFHYVIKRAKEHEFPVTIHVGTVGLPASSLDIKGRYQGINPLNIANLLEIYPDVNFVLLHGGYPWTNEAVCLAFQKWRKNVYIDIGPGSGNISKHGTQSILSDLIATNGGGRIMWGGDVSGAEGAYGTLSIVKDVIARVLSEYVDDKVMSMKNAIYLAEGILSKNAQKIFKT